MSWQQVGIPPNESQFLETQVFELQEIARWYRLQLHKIQELSRATFSNIEAQAIEHITDTIRPRAVKHEQEYTRKLFPTRPQFFVKFNLEGVLRGDSKSRADFYNRLFQMGALSQDDIRALEDLNPLPKGQGADYWVPLNMVRIEDATAPLEAPEPPADPDPEPDPEDERALFRRRLSENRSLQLRRRLHTAHAKRIESRAARFVKAEVNATRKAVRRFLGARASADFVTWAEGFYASHRATVAREMLPVLLAFAEDMAQAAATEVQGTPANLADFVKRYVDSFAVRHADGRLGQLLALVNETEAEALADVIDGRLTEWTERTPAKVGGRESVQAGNAFTKAVWVAAGVRILRWATFGDNCPLCSAMSGRATQITKPFVAKGETVQPGALSGTTPLTATQNFGHPPLHQGCDCMIVPG
jgi:hypothetical protein